jgi:hypothetical protein
VALRLPGSVAEVFEERIRASLPLRAEKILTRVREMRGGKLNDSRFGTRMRGSGRYIETVMELFNLTVKRLGMTREEASPRASTFRRPVGKGGQLSLF